MYSIGVTVTGKDPRFRYFEKVHPVALRHIQAEWAEEDVFRLLYPQAFILGNGVGYNDFGKRVLWHGKLIGNAVVFVFVS